MEVEVVDVDVDGDTADGDDADAPSASPTSDAEIDDDSASAAESAAASDDEGEEYTATQDEDGDSFGYAPGFSEEYMRRQRNIEMLKRGDVRVERETVLPHLLHLTAAERKCYEPFRAHAHLRTVQSEQLAKKKTLGMRGIKNYKIKAFASVGSAGAIAAETHKPCEPLILWSPPEEGAHPKATAIEVDNFICHWLRPHQRIGVQFLWDCVTGCVTATYPSLGSLRPPLILCCSPPHFFRQCSCLSKSTH
jgi:hypothetical protein